MKIIYLLLVTLLFVVAGCAQTSQYMEQQTPTLEDCKMYANSFKQECPKPEPVECPKQNCECPLCPKINNQEERSPIEDSVVNCNPKPIGEYQIIEGWAKVVNEEDYPPNRNYYVDSEIESGYYNPCPQLGGAAP